MPAPEISRVFGMRNREQAATLTTRLRFLPVIRSRLASHPIRPGPAFGHQNSLHILAAQPDTGQGAAITVLPGHLDEDLATQHHASQTVAGFTAVHLTDFRGIDAVQPQALAPSAVQRLHPERITIVDMDHFGQVARLCQRGRAKGEQCSHGTGQQASLTGRIRDTHACSLPEPGHRAAGALPKPAGPAGQTAMYRPGR